MARILVVEDEKIVALDITKNLMDMGHDVPEAVVSGSECIECVSKCVPDLVLMDIRIKGDLDGIATTEILHNRFDVPVIYLTAHADEKTLSRAKLTAPFGYLLKPYKIAELKTTVEIVLSKHLKDKKNRQREKWLSTSLQTVNDAVITVNKTGEITFMNAVAESITGYRFCDVEGKKLIDVMPLVNEKTREMIQSPTIRILKEKKEINFPPQTLLVAQKSKHYVEKSKEITDANGDLSGAVIVFQSEKKENERLSPTIAMTDRLTSMGTLVSSVAHEINNPLSVILANATFVSEELDKKSSSKDFSISEISESMRDVQIASERIKKIVSDLNFFSQPQAEDIQTIDVHRLIDWALRLTNHQILQCAQLKKKFGSRWNVYGSEHRLGQVFVNLIVNAVQAMKNSDDQKNIIEISTWDEDKYVVIEVKDTGCGMSQQTLKRIFDPFFSTKPAGIGTGLGLPISQGIIRSMKGTLHVESTLGQGSKFIIGLPKSSKKDM